MGQFTYSTPAGRINVVKGQILKHSEPKEVLGITGQMKKMPTKQGDNMIFRRYLPYGATTASASTINQWSVTASAHVMQEGVTPNADSLTPQDITVVMQQYGCLYMYTNKAALLYEDDIPPEMKKQTGERMGLVREMIRYGVLKGATNKFYAGGTSRATVDEKISLNLLRRIARNLMGNRADPVSKIIPPGPDFNTTGVLPAFLVFVHTDGENDVRDLPGFKDITEYSSQKKLVHPMEIGSCERFRFIVSPELSAYADSGAAVAGLGLYSTTGTSADVYPFIVVGEDAWGDVALKGKESFDLVDLPPGQKDKNDPHGQRGYIGASCWSAAVVTNQGWMAVAECAIASLT